RAAHSAAYGFHLVMICCFPSRGAGYKKSAGRKVLPAECLPPWLSVEARAKYQPQVAAGQHHFVLVECHGIALAAVGEVAAHQGQFDASAGAPGPECEFGVETGEGCRGCFA